MGDKQRSGDILGGGQSKNFSPKQQERFDAIQVAVSNNLAQTLMKQYPDGSKDERVLKNLDVVLDLQPANEKANYRKGRNSNQKYL